MIAPKTTNSEFDDAQLLNATDPTELLTAGDLACRLRISIRQVRKLHSEALLPAPVRLGRSCRWRSGEIAGWIGAGCPSRATWEKRPESVRIGT